MTEIKIDKSTLPQDGQRVRFEVMDDEGWHEGIYDESDETFTVGFKNTSTKWYWAWNVARWEPLDEHKPDNRLTKLLIEFFNDMEKLDGGHKVTRLAMMENDVKKLFGVDLIQGIIQK